MLESANVDDLTCNTLGDKGWTTVALFGSFATEERFSAFCKRILKVDPETEDDDILKYSRLTGIWEACKARAAIEGKDRIERSVAQLTPQITESDYDSARRA